MQINELDIQELNLTGRRLMAVGNDIHHLAKGPARIPTAIAVLQDSAAVLRGEASRLDRVAATFTPGPMPKKDKPKKRAVKKAARKK